jgi:amidase
LARTVKDAAYLLSAIAGKDAKDNYTSVYPFEPGFKFENYCQPHGLKGMRIGIPRNAFTRTATNGPEIDAFNASITTFKNQGATIVDNANFPDLALYATANNTLVDGVEFIAGITSYFNNLTSNPNNIHTFQDLVNFTTMYRAEDYPDRNIARWVGAMALNLTTASPRYQYERYNDLIAGSNATILGALDKYGLDALIMPTSYSPGYAAIAGYPVVTVSCFLPSINLSKLEEDSKRTGSDDQIGSLRILPRKYKRDNEQPRHARQPWAQFPLRHLLRRQEVQRADPHPGGVRI